MSQFIAWPSIRLDPSRGNFGQGHARDGEVTYSVPAVTNRKPGSSEVDLHQILALRGAIQHYDWGSRTALAGLLGRPAPSPLPEAELWLGAHPNGPADVRVEGGWVPLDALIEREGDALLGPVGRGPHGACLPFLFKVLAVERPLSLQAHPTLAQAQAGFARSQQSGDGIYRDPYPKPELICALSSFTALCGFLPLDQIRERFAVLGLAEWVPAGDDESRVLAGLLGRWLGAPPTVRAETLASALRRLSRRADQDPACARVAALAELYPGDPGVLSPLLLHEVELSPGEAMFLPPGVLHAYLEGVAVELMASSDNVLRGGMTTKPVHVDELLRVLRFESGAPPVLRAEPREPGEGVWLTGADEFELSELCPGPGADVAIETRAGIEILWCASGRLQVQPACGTGLELGAGESCLVPAAIGPYRVAGVGRAFRAGLPLGPARNPVAPDERRTGSARSALKDGPARRRGTPCGS